MHLSAHRLRPRRARGFSMVEVLVTVVVVAIGLLGLAKLQAASVSNSQVSRTRSMVALQADSLASAMHANRAFWTATPPSFSASGATVTDATGTLTTLPSGCTTSTADTCCKGTAVTCTPAQLAAADVNTWAMYLSAQFPSYTGANITCTTVAPINCTIQITWNENYTAINTSTAASTAALSSTQNLTLYVQP